MLACLRPVETQESDILLQKYMIKCEKIFPSLYKETRNATSRLSSATPRCLNHPKSPTKQKVVTISFTLEKDDRKMYL